MKKIIYVAIVVFAVTSCTVQKPLYEWKGYDDAVYAYSKTPDEKNIENLLNVYTKLIDQPGGSRQTVPPGVCADYGYLLIKSGKVKEGKELLIKETILYPESKPFIDRILKRIEE